METSLVIIIIIGLIAIGLGSWFNRKTPNAIPGIVLAVAAICIYAIFLPDLLKEFESSGQTAIFLIISIILILAIAVVLYLGCNFIFKKLFKDKTDTKASISKVPGTMVATVPAPRKRREERKIDPLKPVAPPPELKQLNEKVFGIPNNDQAVTVKKTKLTKITTVSDETPKITKRKIKRSKGNLRSRLSQDHPKVVLVEPESGFEELKEDIFEEAKDTKDKAQIVDIDEGTGTQKDDKTKEKPQGLEEPEIISEKPEKPERSETRGRTTENPEANKKDKEDLVAAVLPDKKYKPTFVRKKKGRHSSEPGEIKVEQRRRRDDGDDFVFPNSRLESGEIAVDLRARAKRATEYSELDEMKLEIPAEALKNTEHKTEKKKNLPPSDIKTAFSYKTKKEFEKAWQAFESCLETTDDIKEKKQIELEILDTLIRMERHGDATTRVFNIISAGYELNSVEKARLVNIMRILENQT